MGEPNNSVRPGPDGAAADVVAAVVAGVLGEAWVDPEAGFFDLGASSAVLVRVVEQLRPRWPGLRVVDLFVHPTVATLAAFLDGGAAS